MNKVTLFQGHVLDKLRELPENSVHCVVTSPPYWGLRDYGTAQWSGGDPECSHKIRENPRIESSGLQGGKGTTGHQKEGFRNTCPRCGAHRIDQQIGLEKTIEEYVAKIVEIFREVRRVLHPAGCLMLNLGDSYMANCGNQNPSTKPQFKLKPKDLCGIPWRVALALQADGWWLRSDIIWAKPNPMPESVTDRPTRSHEYIFLLTKSAKYFWDQEAVREDFHGKDERQWSATYDEVGSINPGTSHAGLKRTKRYPEANGRNLRSVWNIATVPFPQAHFATFPPTLVEKCIKAGCPENGTVLDPFSGSGTTCLVAGKLQRDSIGIELKPEYVEMAKKRLRRELGFLVQVTTTESRLKEG